MTDSLKERARVLAAYALRDARAGDWAAASGHVRQLNAECGGVGTMIAVRAALDKPMFDALIASLPDDKAVIGSYVGAVLETVAITMNGLPEAASPAAGDKETTGA